MENTFYHTYVCDKIGEDAYTYTPRTRQECVLPSVLHFSWDCLDTRHHEWTKGITIEFLSNATDLMQRRIKRYAPLSQHVHAPPDAMRFRVLWGDGTASCAMEMSRLKRFHLIPNERRIIAI